MKEYKAGDIRNVAVVGHGASGKTTLVDALAFVSGPPASVTGPSRTARPSPTTRPKRSSAATPSTFRCAFAEWQDAKINLIDTPGYLDFQGDAIAGLAAADGALCVVSATPASKSAPRRCSAAAIASQ